MKLYFRYVDDEHVICEAVEEDESNKDQPKDERTMKKLLEIGSTIHPSIQLTVDYPSNHANGRMPVLDTEQWIERIQVNGTLKEQVLHSHYTKEMASKFVIHRNSAGPLRSKYNILVADLIRIMRNVSRNCTNEERKKKIEEYMRRMQYSGYSKKERSEIYIRAKRKYDETIRKDNEGVEPLYRSKDWNSKERKEVKKKKKEDWYTRDGSEAVFFVETTPDGVLADSCKKSLKKAGLKVKVVETTGQTIKTALSKSNPFRKTGCNDSTC